MRYTKSFVGCVFILLMLASCTSQDNPKNLELGYDYMPLGNGKEWIYQVDSSVFQQIHGDPDTTYHYQLRVKLDGAWTNAAGEPGWKVLRMVRDSDSAVWNQADVYGWVQNKKEFKTTEENQTYVRLIFPIQNGASWNGNQYNDFKPWNYTFENLGESWSFGALTFNETITVNQANDSNFVNRYFAKEIYAKNVGLVYKLVDTSMVQGGLKEGIRLEQKLIKYIP